MKFINNIISNLMDLFIVLNILDKSYDWLWVPSLTFHSLNPA